MTETKTKAKATAKKTVTTEIVPKKATSKPRTKKVAIKGSPQERYEMIQYAVYLLLKTMGLLEILMYIGLKRKLR